MVNSEMISWPAMDAALVNGLMCAHGHGCMIA